MKVKDVHTLTNIVQQRVVFYDSINDQGILFGGIALKWMDESAYLTALDYSNMPMVTVNVEHVKFLLPITPGSRVRIISFVTNPGKIRLRVKVEIWMSPIQHMEFRKAVEGFFDLVALDANRKPVRMNSNDRKNSPGVDLTKESAPVP